MDKMGSLSLHPCVKIHRLVRSIFKWLCPEQSFLKTLMIAYFILWTSWYKNNFKKSVLKCQCIPLSCTCYCPHNIR